VLLGQGREWEVRAIRRRRRGRIGYRRGLWKGSPSRRMYVLSLLSPDITLSSRLLLSASSEADYTFPFQLRTLNFPSPCVRSTHLPFSLARTQPERWLPLKARTSTLNNPSSSSSSTKTGKKGGKKPEGMTAGFTQGSVSMLPQSSASAGGSGGKKKKGRK
jgi:hypothetical protein